ncbi:unnamed protein product [Dovyalis caffra]|uniref:phenylalanine--tRNA ligase n=1 Tax=Dovyalis caffra TaxID=77055 RepID=A0AAV1R8K8_9ROSI|nr:unnamed protein product [Dovyalis caffra]
MAEEAILGYLKNDEEEEISDSGQFAIDHGLDHSEVVNVIKSLHGFRYIIAKDIKRDTWVLTEEGEKYAEQGSPEVRLFLAVPEEGSISKEELQKLVDPAVFKIGCSQAAKNKWVQMGNQISRKVQHVEDRIKDLLLRIRDGQEIGTEDKNSLKARKLIAIQTWKGYSVRRGPDYAPIRRRTATDLTREYLQGLCLVELLTPIVGLNYELRGMLVNNFGSMMKAKWAANYRIGVAIYTPKFLFIVSFSVKERLKDIFRLMNFEEMPTNRYVESSFWNFDVLFQPQQHPARDSHDTFFLKAPETTKQLPEDYVELVKRVHEAGGYGSRGYGYDWKREEANKNLLRTHTTAISSRMLYALAQHAKQQSFTPKRYFSIDRVFRNEAVDRTHLAEFHQIEDFDALDPIFGHLKSIICGSDGELLVMLQMLRYRILSIVDTDELDAALIA